MRRQGQRDLRIDLSEERSSFRQSVNVRCALLFISVATETVSSESVH